MTSIDRARGHGALRIGITGPIGCGKSTVAGWLAERGAAVIDADAVARAVTPPGSRELADIVAAFGPGVLRADGSLDRPALGRIVFGDPAALRRLEAIVHPAVRPRILEAIAGAEASGAPLVVVEAIKLVEGGLAAICDSVWLVTCGPEAQVARLEARGQPDAAQRIRAQGDIRTSLERAADEVIDTTGSPEAARAAVLEALDRTVARDGQSGGRPRREET
jgi:dephospho-CoA kinase